MRVTVEIERGNRQARHIRRAEPCQRQRGIGRRSMGKPGLQAPPSQPGGEIARHVCLALPPFGEATGQVEHQRRIPHCRDRRGVAFAGLHQPHEQRAVGPGIMGKGGELGNPRARIGQRHARAQPERERTGRQRHDPQRAALLFDYCEGRIRRRGAGGDPPFRGQERQVRRQIAAFGRQLAHGSIPIAHAARQARRVDAAA